MAYDDDECRMMIPFRKKIDYNQKMQRIKQSHKLLLKKFTMI